MLHCGFCPNKGLADRWLRGDLPWEVYRDGLGPHLGRFETVYLQGWGEPMLHPRLWDMIALAKGAGAKAGFTTCGGLLSEETVTRVLDLGVDILSISFAGATPGTHDRLRRGSHFELLAANVSALTARRKSQGSPRPFVELHFLMMRDNIAELPEFVEVAASLGADEVVATNLTYTPTTEVAANAVFGRDPRATDVDTVARAAECARQLGLRFRAYPLAPFEQAMLECDARPTQTGFVTVRGELAPCVYLGVPAEESIPRVYEGESRPTTRITFGDVRNGFISAFEGREREAFCAPFRARKAMGGFAFSVLNGPDATLPAPPEPCSACYKLWGL
jgi:MoaA/NifB/PqqE/SkfB family radical SAM enzyme